MKKAHKPDFFTRFTSTASAIFGRPWIFVIAVAVLVIWGLTGPLLHYSDTWQLIINTSTTIVTFLMVFIIQNTQNRDNMAINLKLDALLQKMRITREELLDAEDMADTALEEAKQRQLAKKNSSPKKRKSSSRKKR